MPNPFEVLFEDNHLLVVVKPAGVIVQTDVTGQIDLLTQLKTYVKEKYDKPGDVYMGLVHRLDQPVRGVMVFARTSKAASRLSEAVRNRVIGKTYLAIVKGKTPHKLDCVDFLSKDTGTNTAEVVEQTAVGAKEAKLHFQTLRYNKTEDVSLLRIELETGRPHQIRIQLSSRGWPILGDMKYGSERGTTDLALLSAKLSFQHPVTKAPMEFSTHPVPFHPWTLFDAKLYSL